MRRTTWRAIAVAASFAAVTALAQPAYAGGPINGPAIDVYSKIAQAELGDQVGNPDDNVTCDPEPVVRGEMLAPGAPFVVGETYSHAVMAGHLKCASLDTSKGYWLDACITDMYWADASWRYEGGATHCTYTYATKGAATVNPMATLQYKRGGPGYDTLHYIYFEGWTSTGQYRSGVSPLFYVYGF